MIHPGPHTQPTGSHRSKSPLITHVIIFDRRKNDDVMRPMKTDYTDPCIKLAKQTTRNHVTHELVLPGTHECECDNKDEVGSVKVTEPCR